MAMVANSGLARSIRPIHGMGDGDAVFGMATTDPAPGSTVSLQDLQAIYNAASDALGRAVVHALLEGGVYCDQFPSACGTAPPEALRRKERRGTEAGSAPAWLLYAIFSRRHELPPVHRSS